MARTSLIYIKTFNFIDDRSISHRGLASCFPFLVRYEVFPGVFCAIPAFARNDLDQRIVLILRYPIADITDAVFSKESHGVIFKRFNKFSSLPSWLV